MATTKSTAAKKTTAKAPAKKAPAKSANSNSELTRPEHWIVGGTTKDGFTVVRVRSFFAVLKKTADGKPTTWATELITGRRLKATSSANAGEVGRAYRDEQQAKGVKVSRARKVPATKKAPAEKRA